MIVVCKNANTVSSKNKNTSQFKKKKKKRLVHISFAFMKLTYHQNLHL